MATEKALPHLPWEPLKVEMRKGSVVKVATWVGGEEESAGCLGSRRLGRLRRRVLRKFGRSGR